MLRRTLLILFFALLSPALAAQKPHYAGRPLATVLRELQQGVAFTFTDVVVPSSLTVEQEPQSTTPRAIVEELLRQQSLCLDPSSTVVRCDMRNMPVALEQIVVTPSSFEIYRSEPGQRQAFGREEVQRLPHIGDDLFRALAYVPGATSGDISARMNIRGGEEDESIVLLDGAEIYDPFHLRDLFRTFSTIDSESVGGVEMSTGGFTAEYGGRMGGVIDVSTLAASARKTEAGASILNTRILAAGPTKTGGNWLVSARRGYLRELIKLVANRNELDPVYYDVLAKAGWTIGDRTTASVHLLASHDRLRLVDVLDATMHAAYSDLYAWATLGNSWQQRAYSRTIMSYGRMSTDRRGSYGTTAQSQNGSVTDERRTSLVTAKNDTTLNFSARNLLKAGFVARDFRSHYEYSGSAVIRRSFLNPAGPPIVVNRAAKRSPSAFSAAVYAADRFRIGESVVVEPGVRFERESEDRGGSFTSPRLNALWLPTPRLIVRLAWGVYRQPEQPYELRVEDGITSPQRPQKSVQKIAGLEYSFQHGVTARLELYDKRIHDPHVRFENLYDRFVIFPELHPDRVRIAPSSSSARGAEIFLRKESSSRVSGWISYAHATAIDTIDGRDVPRSWDQPDTVTFSANLRAPLGLNLNTSGTWHGGRPTTPVDATYVAGKLVTHMGTLNSERLPDYKRVDLRASRAVPTKRGAFGFFVELYNVLNNANVSRVDAWRYPKSAGGATPVYESVVGVVPSFGVSWEF